MEPFKIFYKESFLIREGRYGKSDTVPYGKLVRTLLSTPDNTSYVYKSADGVYSVSSDAPTPTRPSVATLSYTAGGIIVNAIPTERTNLMHIFRFKPEQLGIENKPNTDLLSDAAVNNVVNSLSNVITNRFNRNVEENLQKIIFVSPGSRSQFNTKVRDRLSKKFPGVRIFTLDKNQLSNIPADQLFPIDHNSLTDREKLNQWIYNVAYSSFQQQYPTVQFSKDTVSKELRRFIADSVKNNDIELIPTGQRNMLSVKMFGRTLPLSTFPKPLINRIIDSNGFYDIGENITKANKANIFNTNRLPERKPGDVVFAFDDNTSTDFTSKTIERQIRNLGFAWGGMYVGTKFPLRD